jgi:murein L,D-transpeptidase YcbB/YkuD
MVFGQLIAAADEAEAAALMQQRIEQLRQAHELTVEGTPIRAIRVIPLIYEEYGFGLVWKDRDRLADLLDAIRDMSRDGLDPEDYHLTRLQSMHAERDFWDAAAYVDADLLASDALIVMAYHLSFGKVDPERLDPNWNFHIDFETQTALEFAREAVAAPSIAALVANLRPRRRVYPAMMDALAHYRELAENGGWAPVPAGAVLKEGVRDERVVRLRERLAITGDLPPGFAKADPAFDADLAAAVERFQERHGLGLDGVVGPNTLEALSVPVERRIDQLRVNLERVRWVSNYAGDTYILVSIAGFVVYYVVDGVTVWRGRAQVGKDYRQTPVFTASLTYLEFNPTWTVPPTILAKDVLPAIQKDVSYLSRKRMKVLDHQGSIVSPDKVKWSQYNGKGFPYIIRQDPGPENALGRVKFIFPNEHFVFVHDTPSKTLFKRADRTFSSGCIRVEHPFELAELVLGDSENWNRESILALVESAETRRVHLREPLQVLVIYLTAFAGIGDVVQFRGDVYDRDAAVLRALGGEIRARKHHERSRPPR